MREEYRGLGVVGSVALLVYLLDRASKLWVEGNIPLNGQRALIPGLTPYVSLTHWQNSGVAFGLLPNQTLLWLLIAVVLLAAIYLYFHYLPLDRTWTQIFVGMQIGGAFGNLTDRYLHGVVTDFLLIGIPWSSRLHYWPAFNVADAAISTGVVLLALFLLLVESKSVPESEGGNSLPRPL